MRPEAKIFIRRTPPPAEDPDADPESGPDGSSGDQAHSADHPPRKQPGPRIQHLPPTRDLHDHPALRPATPRTSLSTLLAGLALQPNPLSGIPRDRPLVVFTPYLRAPPLPVDPADATDPFEGFARALARGGGGGGGGGGGERREVRHVPYVARVGLSAEHARHAREAGGVVVVMCAPESVAAAAPARHPGAPSGPTARQLDAVMFQLAFARDAALQLLEHRRPSLLVAINIQEYFDPVPYSAVVELADWSELEKATGILCDDLSAGMAE
jgi:hypothetical protein